MIGTGIKAVLRVEEGNLIYILFDMKILNCPEIGERG